MPHGWEARVLFDQATRTVLCGDLFTHFGKGPATTSDDIVTLAAFAEDVFGATCLTRTPLQPSSNSPTSSQPHSR